jgi:hypothetical protein
MSRLDDVVRDLEAERFAPSHWWQTDPIGAERRAAVQRRLALAREVGEGDFGGQGAVQPPAKVVAR